METYAHTPIFTDKFRWIAALPLTSDRTPNLQLLGEVSWTYGNLVRPCPERKSPVLQKCSEREKPGLQSPSLTYNPENSYWVSRGNCAQMAQTVRNLPATWETQV